MALFVWKSFLTPVPVIVDPEKIVPSMFFWFCDSLIHVLTVAAVIVIPVHRLSFIVHGWVGRRGSWLRKHISINRNRYHRVLLLLSQKYMYLFLPYSKASNSSIPFKCWIIFMFRCTFLMESNSIFWVQNYHTHFLWMWPFY